MTAAMENTHESKASTKVMLAWSFASLASLVACLALIKVGTSIDHRLNRDYFEPTWAHWTAMECLMMSGLAYAHVFYLLGKSEGSKRKMRYFAAIQFFIGAVIVASGVVALTYA